MSHQDKMSDSIVNHQVIKQVVDWLFPPALFSTMKTCGGATWKPRMLVVAGLLWGCSGKGNLTDRFEQARKIVRKVFHWQPPPGATYQGFTKMLHKWHAQLMLAVVPDVQMKMKEVLPGQWEIAGYVVYAADGSRIELARTEALEAFYSPQRKKQRKKKKQDRRTWPQKRCQTQGRLQAACRPETIGCPNNAKLEIDWSLLALWCICLLAQRELVNSGQSPSSLSPVSAIKAFQDILHDWRVRPENRGQSLCIRLRGALLDHYERTSSKTSRNYPRKKKEHKHTGPPKLFSARKQQVTAAKELKRQKYEIQLTA